MIVLTTPTGNIGTQVLDRLLTRTDERVRVVARDPERLAADVRDRVEVVVGSHGDPEVIDHALTGADALFWLTPPPLRVARLEEGMEGFAGPAGAAVARHGVRHVVGVSNLGRGVPGYAGMVTHGLAVEDLFAASGAAFRAITLPGFMENLLRSLADLRDRGRFAAAQDHDRKMPMCATADVAEVAAGLLLERRWEGVGHRAVLGPEDLTMDECAEILTEVLGRRIEYVQIGTDELRAGLVAHGASEAAADGIAAMMVAKNAGLDNAEPRTPESSSPTSFRTWCETVLRPALEAETHNL